MQHVFAQGDICSPARDYIEADSKARLSQPRNEIKPNVQFSERLLDNKGRAFQSVSGWQLAHVTVGGRTPRGTPEGRYCRPVNRVVVGVERPP